MATTKKSPKKSECAVKTKKSFQAGMIIGQKMNKSIGKKKK